MKEVEKRLEAACRYAGAFWDGEDGRYFLWKGEKWRSCGLSRMTTVTPMTYLVWILRLSLPAIGGKSGNGLLSSSSDLLFGGRGGVWGGYPRLPNS